MNARTARGAGLAAGAGVLCIFFLASAAPTTPDAPRAAAPAPASASTELARIADDYWQHQVADDLATRVREGLPAEHLPDLSPEYAEREAAWAAALRERLARIDDKALGHEDWLTLALLRQQADEAIEARGGYWHVFLATPYDAPFSSVHTALAAQRLTTAADLAAYLRLLHAYTAMVEQLRRHLAGQAERGMRLPKPEVDAVTAMLRSYAQPPAASALTVAADRLHGFDAAAVAAFQAASAHLVADEIDPALVSLADELAGDYRQRAPEAIGLGQYPGGAAAYRMMIRFRTGFDLPPEEIHRRGLAAVERLSQRMAEVRRQLGFTGTAREFHQQLRRDPRFLARNPQEVADRLMAAVRRMEPKIPSLFLHVPQAPYGVAPLPTALGAMTFGYYQTPTPAQPKGLYLYNAGQLDQRPLVGAAALIYHELIPGHHFQLALQAENTSLPLFRRYLFHTSFVEGWGEYASHLGEEAGLYDDPYALYGRLAMDMFLSSRLVVDTGLNALGWSRQQAADFMRERLIESDAQIDSEVLRYAIALPAQALAYKLGSQNIEDLRAHAAAALGPRFDVRRFHDAVLGSGSLPPAILARHIDWWIAEEQKR